MRLKRNASKPQYRQLDCSDVVTLTSGLKHHYEMLRPHCIVGGNDYMIPLMDCRHTYCILMTSLDALNVNR